MMKMARSILMNGFEAVPRMVMTAHNTAVFLQDPQRYWVDDEYGFLATVRRRGTASEFHEYFAQLDDLLPNMQRVIDGARRLDLPVIYSIWGPREPGEISALQRAVGAAFTAGSPEAEIVEDVIPRGGDTISHRSGLSAFSEPDLTLQLRRLGVENILVVGLLIEYGLRSTVYDASDRGFRPLVVDDACIGLTYDARSTALDEMKFGLTKVRSTGETLEILQRLGRGDPVLV
ncbi:MAG: cysteine hydrolase family protein [Clostridia bacterium]